MALNKTRLFRPQVKDMATFFLHFAQHFFHCLIVILSDLILSLMSVSFVQRVLLFVHKEPYSVVGIFICVNHNREEQPVCGWNH